MTGTRILITGIIATAFALGPAVSTDAANLLSNASFEIEGSSGAWTTFTGLGVGGNSAAQSWTVFNNMEGTTTTELMTTWLPGGGNLMLRVTTHGGANGLVQQFAPNDTGPPCVISGVWVYVVSGTVFVGSGNGGATGPNVWSMTTGEWEYLSAENGGCPVNELIIYSGWGEDFVEFFVDLATCEPWDCRLLPQDVNQDGQVNVVDLLEVLGHWGPCTNCPADINGDDQVNVTDLLALLGAFGDCP